MDDKDKRIADLERKVNLMWPAIQKLNGERRAQNLAPLLDEQILMINRNVADNLGKAKVPTVKHPTFDKPAA